MIQENTQQFPDGYDFNNVGLVFFDASHDYGGLSAELNSWYPLIREYGHLIIHDYGMEKHKGITRAVNEFVQKHKLKIARVERSVIIQKGR